MKKKIIFSLFILLSLFLITGCNKGEKEDSTTTLNEKVEKKYYENGTEIYFNPETGTKCSKTESISTTEIKNGCMKWYAFNDNNESNTLNLLLDHNTTADVAWNSQNTNSTMKEVEEALKSDIQSWKEDIQATARLITATEIATIVGNSTFSPESNSFIWFDENIKAKNVTKGENKYGWLFDYTQDCIKSGCNVEDNNKYSIYKQASMFSSSYTSDYTVGYWTSTKVTNDSSLVWRVGRSGQLYGITAGMAYLGIRPVITIPKALIQ